MTQPVRLRYAQNFSGGKVITRQGEGKATTPESFYARAKIGPSKQVSSELAAGLNAAPRSLKEAYNSILKMDRLFAQVPAKVRGFFENNPQKLLEAIHTPLEKMDAVTKQVLVESGIVRLPKAKVEPGPVKVQVVATEVDQSKK